MSEDLRPTHRTHRRTFAAWGLLFLACWSTPVLSASGPQIVSEQPGQPFRTLAVLEVGRNPHQIAFTQDGKTAVVAVAGSDWLTLVDRKKLVITRKQNVPSKPLGVAISPENEVFVSRFASDRISSYRLQGWLSGHLIAGPSPSLIIGPLPDGNHLISVEGDNRMSVVDLSGLRIVESYPTGRRPFPPCATSEGRFAFVPNYDDGTVTKIDRRKKTTDTFWVGRFPSGGAVLPGDEFVALVLRGEDRVSVVDVDSLRQTATFETGDAPFSIILAPRQGMGFVSNSESSNISVISLAGLQSVATVAVGDGPLVMAIPPDEKTLWVSCDGSGDVYVLEIPENFVLPRNRAPLEVIGPAALAQRRKRELTERCEKEVRQLHQFLQHWLSSKDQDNKEFERFSEGLAEDFEAVFETGRVVSRQEFLASVRESRSRFEARSLKIWVEGLRPRRLAQGVYLVTYEHWQQLDEEKTRRLSNAILRERTGTPNRLEWVHLHEVEVVPGSETR